MLDSKKDALAVAGAAGVGLAAAVLLRRALKKRDQGTIPDLKLPSGCYFSLQALFNLGGDNVNYGTGRLVLQSCDPSIGIGQLTVLGQTTVLLRSPELVKEVIRGNHQAGGGYGKSFKGNPFDPLIDKLFGRGLFFAEDQDVQWAVAHKILSKPFSHKGIMSMVPLMCEQADRLLSALEHEAASGKAVYMYDYMVKMALETIAVMSMGTRFNVFDTQEPHPFPIAFQAAVESLYDLAFLPQALWPFCFRTRARMAEAVSKLNSIIDDIVQRRIRKETCSSGESPDLLDIMLNGEKGPKLSEENIRAQILTFLFAGHDSTAAALSSFIVFMLANPRVEAKLLEEISEVVGDGELEARHLPKLQYLDWCLKETMRLLPPANGFQRMAFQESLVLGEKWKIKQWTPVLVDIFALHMDPQTWGANAASFVPERWEAGPPHPYSYMPFASGPRGCIGKEFSLIEQKIVAVKLFRKFKLRSLSHWTPRKGNVLIKASSPLPFTSLGIDAEFCQTQTFAGASIPVELHVRERLVSTCASSSQEEHILPPSVYGGA
jgi:cytochrome P450